MPSLAELRQRIPEEGITDEFATKANAIAGRFRDEVLIRVLPLSCYIRSNPKKQIAAYPPELLEWVYFLNSSSRVEKTNVDLALRSLIRSEFKTVGEVRKAGVEDLWRSGQGMGPIRAGLLKLIFEPLKEKVE